MILVVSATGLALHGQAATTTTLNTAATSSASVNAALISVAAGLQETASQRTHYLDKKADPAGEAHGKPIPAGHDAHTQKEVDQKYAAWLEKKFLVKYQNLTTTQTAGDPKVIQFLRDILPLTMKEGTAGFAELEKQGKALLAGGCRDARVMLMCGIAASRLKKNKEAMQLLQDADKWFQGGTGTKIPRAQTHILLEQMTYDTMGPAAAAKWVDLAMADILDAAHAGEFAPGEEPFADRMLRRFLPHADSNSITPAKWGKLWTLTQTRTKLSPWLRYMIQGEMEIEAAWKARGFRWASGVTPEGWRDFSQHMQQAQAALTEAWKLHPDFPQAPTEMIKVATAGMSGAGEPARTWFDRAVAAQVDFIPAYDAFIAHLSPRWHGSHKEELRFARECLATGRFDTRVPLYYLVVLHMIGEEYPNDTWRAAFRQADVHKDLEQLFAGYLKEPSWAEKHTLLLTQQAVAEAWCGSYEKAREMLAKLPADAPFDGTLQNWPVTWGDMGRKGFEAEVRAFTGPRKNVLVKAEGLALERKFGEAVPLFLQALEASKADQDVYAYLRDRIAWMCMGGTSEEIGSDSLRMPPQHLAARNDHPEVLEFLLTHGADPNGINEDTWTPLNLAVRYGAPEDARILLDHGADPNLTPKLNHSPLSLAIQKNRMGFACLLMQRKADLDYHRKDTQSPLYAAVDTGRWDLTLMLLRLGANPNPIEQSMMTPLCRAAKKNYFTLAQLLLENGADPNFASPSGYTPLHYAAYYGSTECVKILLEHGARRDVKLPTGHTPFALAKRYNHPEVAKLLSAPAAAH